MPRARKIEIAVVNGDVLEFEADVLVLKYAQALYGADRAAWGRLEAVYPDIDLPEVGDHRVVESEPALSAAQVLFIGVEPLHAFGYAEIREFSRRALSILSGHPAGARNIALTIHGPGYGLDEVEAFRSEVAGVIEAMTAQEYPKDLVRITFVERDKRRSKRLSRVLAKVFPDGNIATSGRGSLQTLPEDTQKALRSAGYGSGAKPHVFVAMPFVPEMDDIFYFGIEGPVTAASLLAERADLSTNTGDVMERVRSRIATARLVVADISTSNPNVCLEVGYAWGKGVPTVLLVKKGAERPFDLRGQRCIVYATIRDLASQLARELQGLEAHNS